MMYRGWIGINRQTNPMGVGSIKRDNTLICLPLLAKNVFKGVEQKMINTHHGYFEYQVSPFGLSNALAVFQVLVNDVLHNFIP